MDSRTREKIKTSVQESKRMLNTAESKAQSDPDAALDFLLTEKGGKGIDVALNDAIHFQDDPDTEMELAQEKREIEKEGYGPWKRDSSVTYEEVMDIINSYKELAEKASRN